MLCIILILVCNIFNIYCLEQSVSTKCSSGIPLVNDIDGWLVKRYTGIKSKIIYRSDDNESLLKKLTAQIENSQKVETSIVKGQSMMQKVTGTFFILNAVYMQYDNVVGIVKMFKEKQALKYADEYNKEMISIIEKYSTKAVKKVKLYTLTSKQIERILVIAILFIVLVNAVFWIKFRNVLIK